MPAIHQAFTLGNVRAGMANGDGFHKDVGMRLRLVLVSSAALVGLAAPAHADPDGDFLGALNSAGISYRSGPDAVATGRRACQLMDQGHPEPDVVKDMTEENKGFTIDAATRFVQLAESNFCPQHTGGAVAPSQQWNPPPFFPWPPLPSL